MAPKNKKKNSFYFYMKELQRKEAARGYNISLEKLASTAHPKWKAMSLAERQPYEEMARKYKNNPDLRGGKLASDGTRVEDNLKEQEEKVYLRNKMKQDIKHYLNINCTTEEEFRDFATKKLLYFMTFNIQCCKDDNTYIPLEVGIIEYSIQHGIHREYTRMISPGRPPTGYAGIAKQLSEEKHQIAFCGEEGGVTDMKVLYNELKAFANPFGTDEYPPIFCEETNMDVTAGCLDWLSKAAREENVFEVWNAAFLLMELRAGVGKPFPSEIIASDLLNKTSFSYHPSTRCEFHETKDVHFCALSYSKRICYLLSDAICNLFNVQLTERHIPARAVEDKAYIVTAFKEGVQPARQSSIRLDKVDNYYKNEGFENINHHVKPIPRQPASTCVAEEMSRLKLNMAEATVPGHGIGRGIRRNTTSSNEYF